MRASTAVAAGAFATGKGGSAGAVITGWAVGVVTIAVGLTAVYVLGAESAADTAGGAGCTTGSCFALSTGAGCFLGASLTAAAAGASATGTRGAAATGWAVGVVTIAAGLTAVYVLGVEPATDTAGGAGCTTGSSFALSAGAGCFLGASLTAVAAGAFAAGRGGSAGAAAPGWAVSVVTIPVGVAAVYELGAEVAADTAGGAGRAAGSSFPLSACTVCRLRA